MGMLGERHGSDRARLWDVGDPVHIYDQVSPFDHSRSMQVFLLAIVSMRGCMLNVGVANGEGQKVVRAVEP